LHGHWGEGGPLQELLEQLCLPYVGSQPRAARLAMDKMQSKALMGQEGVPTPAAQELQPDRVCTIKPPLVIKPVDDGSSVDLRICRSEAEVASAREILHPRRNRLMAEAYIEGRELTVGIVLDQPLPLIEIIPAVQFYDYEAKYTRDDTQYVIGPELPPGISDRCVSMAMAAYRTLGCRDVARVDIMFDGVKPWFLEINTMPGFTTHSLVPMAARKRGANATRGWEMPELCSHLAHAALARIHAQAQARSEKAALHAAR
jgi:D-alanine-D-alanine ligase